jgi:hypothetical protein
MPQPSKRSSSSARAAATGRPATRRMTREPAALRRFNKSLDSAQSALASLRKDLSKDVGAGARDLHRDLGRFVKAARRDSGRLSKAIQRDLEQAQKRLAGASSGKGAVRSVRRKTSTARKPSARRSSGSRSTSR